VSRIGRGGPGGQQCADAAKRSCFDRVDIMLAASASVAVGRAERRDKDGSASKC